MSVRDAQVRKLMEEYNKHGIIKTASMMSGMDRKTGSKYIKSGVLPSDIASGLRCYRTREDPFEEDWPTVKLMLKSAPSLQAKFVFAWLQEQNPDRYEPGQVRTLQRKFKHWFATEGPDKETFFGQQHRPGEAMQMDFTNCNELGITINKERFDHLLCHCVLPFSNWEWTKVCLSESLMALRKGVQSALFQLGKYPEFLQTDNLSAATHELGEGSRGFNEQYKEFVHHFKMKPRKIGVGKCNQNGDVESSNGVLKRCLEQYLLLRGNRNFVSVEVYEKWVQGIAQKNNELRKTKVTEELKHMNDVLVNRLKEYKAATVRVTRESTIQVMRNTYSVPSRLCGEKVKVNIYDDKIDVFYGGIKQLTIERLLGRSKHKVNYRHIIWSLVKKPGAFARYRYRDDLFPSKIFRLAYESLCDNLGDGYKSDLEYLRILHRAASESEFEVSVALDLLLSENQVPLADSVKDLIQTTTPEIPELVPYDANLDAYDELLDVEVSQ
jgi:hypothetical protein